jgi:hypothetical protein
MNVNVSDVTDQIQELIRSGTPVDPRRLVDPDVPLESLAEGASDGLGGLLEAAARILVQGANYPRRLITGRLAKGEALPASELAPRRRQDHSARRRGEARRLPRRGGNAPRPLARVHAFSAAWSSGMKRSESGTAPATDLVSIQKAA